MADKLTAINMMRPKLAKVRMIEINQLEQFIADRSGVSRVGILQILDELRAALLFFCLDGRSLRIEELGRISPKIGQDGTISYSMSPDSKVLKRMNKDLFNGTIINRDHIGKTPDELIAILNEIHPEDPVG